MYCINKNSVEFQTLKQKSGLSETVLSAICGKFMETVGRFPHLDELPTDSKNYLKDNIKLNKNNSTKLDNIFKYTGTNNVQEANVKLNDLHEDLEIELIPLKTESVVNVEDRPNIYKELEREKTDTSKADTNVYLNQITDRLSKLYGIQVNVIHTSDLYKGEFADKIVDPEFSAAFIYNGQIYVNADIASIDAPIHELMHLLLGGLRFKHTDLYMSLVNSAESFKGYNELTKLYSNRTRTDINEEIFVSELSKYLTGQESQLSSLDEGILYEISYNTHRMIDTLLKGKWSSVSLGDNVYSMSLRSLAEQLNSVSLNNTFTGFISDSEVHRMLANKKQELFEQGKLKEYC